MWTLAIAIFIACKGLTWWRRSIRDVPFWRHAGYLLAWPGLDADAFLSPLSTPRAPTIAEWIFGLAKFLSGVAILFAIRWVSPEHPYLVGWVGMIGIIFILHFGLFHLLSCAWRSAGVDARPLMNWPVRSVSVSEFWGRRWNTAFRDLTHRFLFRPLAARVGARRAILVGFLFSGLVHDAVISVPAGGGYGGPSVFFAVQGTAMLVERSTFGRSIGLGARWTGWLFTMVVLLIPAPYLFHPPFVERIIVPFLQAVRAL